MSKTYKENPLMDRDLRDLVYATQMVELQKEQQVKKPVNTEQSPSTARLLAMNEKELADYRDRPLADCQVKDKYGNIVINKREIDPEIAVAYQEHRMKSKNTLGDAVSYGATSVSPEKREKAIDAYVCSQPVEITAEQATKLQELTPVKAVVASQSIEAKEEPKKGFASKIYHYFWKKGLPVNKITPKQFSVEIANEDEEK